MDQEIETYDPEEQDKESREDAEYKRKNRILTIALAVIIAIAIIAFFCIRTMRYHNAQRNPYGRQTVVSEQQEQQPEAPAENVKSE